MVIGALGGGLVAALITSAISLLALNKTLANQRAEATAQDRRNLRDARSARTRRSLGLLLGTALQIKLVANEPLLTDAPMREELLERRKDLAAMWPQLLKSRSQVLSEPDGLKWMTDFEDQVLLPFREFEEAVRDDSDRRQKFLALNDGIARFQAAVSAHFATLDRPI